MGSECRKVRSPPHRQTNAGSTYASMQATHRRQLAASSSNDVANNKPANGGTARSPLSRPTSEPSISADSADQVEVSPKMLWGDRRPQWGSKLPRGWSCLSSSPAVRPIVRISRMV